MVQDFLPSAQCILFSVLFLRFIQDDTFHIQTCDHTLKEPMIFSCRILISFSSEIPSSAPSKRKSAPTPKICFSRYRFFMETPFSPYSISPINFAVTPSCSASSSLESPRSSRRFRIRAPIADLFNSLNSAIHIPPHSRGYSL